MAKSRSDGGARQAHSGSRFLPRKLGALLGFSASLPCLLPGPLGAAQWDIQPSIALEERYSDNVALTQDDEKKGDWITRVVPGISVTGLGSQLRFNANYAPEIIYYAGGQGEDDVFQRGSAIGNAEFIQDLLFLDFGARIDQYNASLQGPQASSNANDTGNRATVQSYSLSPYARHSFGGSVEGEARFTGSVVDSNDTSVLPNSVADRVDLKFNSGPSYKLLTWNADYFRENIDYQDEENGIFSEVATGGVKRLITPTIGFLAQLGYDKYEIRPENESFEGAAWSAGFDWTPSPRTRFAFTAGRRFYGDDYFLDIGHRTRLTTWGVAYIQQITTTRSEFFVLDQTRTEGYLNTLFSSQYPDPADREKAVQEFIARTGIPSGLSAPSNFFTSELFLVKRWQTSAGILGTRNVVIANLFKESRETLSGQPVTGPGAGDFSASNAVDQTGGSIQWNLRLTEQSAWNLGGGYNRNQFSGSDRLDDFTYVGMGLSHRFEPRLTGSLNYRHEQNRSNVDEGNHTENAVFATIQKRF